MCDSWMPRGTAVGTRFLQGTVVLHSCTGSGPLAQTTVWLSGEIGKVPIIQRNARMHGVRHEVHAQQIMDMDMHRMQIKDTGLSAPQRCSTQCGRSSASRSVDQSCDNRPVVPPECDRKRRRTWFRDRARYRVWVRIADESER